MLHHPLQFIGLSPRLTWSLACRDVDIPLTEKGVMEALAGGRAVCEIDFDIIFTSRLVRAKQTALIAMTQVWIHNLLYMPKAFVIVCDAFGGCDQCCLVYRWTHGIKEPTYGYQNYNTNQILIFGGYPSL